MWLCDDNVHPKFIGRRGIIMYILNDAPDINLYYWCIERL